MEDFAGYLWHLLTAPYKAVAKAKNCWWMLAKALGAQYDDAMAKLRWVRLQSMLLTCDDAMLAVHGEDRGMPRLKGESYNAYRLRLTSKREIAMETGTIKGILAAVKALGYPESYIEPLYLADTTRWAEFRIWLQTGSNDLMRVNDMAVIDQEVMAVKPASSMPTYGISFGSIVELQTSVIMGTLIQPLCGTMYCGQYPPRSDEI